MLLRESRGDFRMDPEKCTLITKNTKQKELPKLATEGRWLLCDGRKGLGRVSLPVVGARGPAEDDF